MKFNTKILLGVTVLSLTLTACAEPVLVSTEDVGQILNITIKPPSFSSNLEYMMVQTTKGFFKVAHIQSIMVGESSTLQTYSDGRRYLCSGKCYYLYH